MMKGDKEPDGNYGLPQFDRVNFQG